MQVRNDLIEQTNAHHLASSQTLKHSFLYGLFVLGFGLVFYSSSEAWAKRERLPWTRAKTPSQGKAQSIGSYANGCLQGAMALPSQGMGYTSIRRYRHRYFAHPNSIAFVKKLGQVVQQKKLNPMEIGDLSQVRGGLMSYGHRSHQSGLDIDIWFGGDQNYLDGEAKRRLTKLKLKAKQKKVEQQKIKAKTL